MASRINVPLHLKATENVSNTLGRVKRSFGTFGAAMNKARSQFNAFNKENRKHARNMKKWGGMMKDAGQRMTLGITLPTAAAGVAAVRTYADLERSLVAVGKTSNIEGAKLEALGQDFFKLSQKVPLATTELMKIGEVGGQSGISDPKRLIEFSEAIGKLKIASAELDVTEGAKAIAKIANLTKGGRKGFTQIASSLVDLGNNAAASEPEILAVALRVAQGTAMYKMAAPEVFGLSTAIKEMGGEAELAGSVMQRFFLESDRALRKPGDKQAAALQAITGIKNIQKLKGLLKDSPMEFFRTVLKGLREINESGGSAALALEGMDLKGVRINSILLPFLETMNEFGDDMLVFDHIDRGIKAARLSTKDSLNALDKEFAQFAATLSARWQMFKNSLSFLSFQTVEPISDVLKSLTDFSAGLAGLLGNNPELRKFLLIFVGLGAIMGPLAISFGMFVAFIPFLQAGLAALGGGVGVTALVFFGKLLGIMLLFASVSKIVNDLMNDWNLYVDAFNIGIDKMARGLEGFMEDMRNKFFSLFDTGVMKKIKDFFNRANVNVKNQIEMGRERQAPRPSSQIPNTVTPRGNNAVDVNQNATLSIKVDGPPGTSARVIDSSGFSVLNINRGLQGAMGS